VAAGIDQLADGQRNLLDAWMPGAAVVRDHSWGLVGTVVLELDYQDVRYIAKAGDAEDLHIAREVRAHREWLAPWTSQQRAPELVHADADAKLLVCRFLQGDLVQGRHDEWLPDVYRQAGALLAELHGQFSTEDPIFEERQKAKALAWLDRPHRIAQTVEKRLRAEIASWPSPPVSVVPTHGDWQPRNWLIQQGLVKVIDFGRAELRPGFTDLARLSVQQFRVKPDLEVAFVAGYGRDPREPDGWHRNQVREAIGTAAWAHQVGDLTFEQQGHRMIAKALANR
jgi:aminoglycoside/choline kinase family phosphotransferase